MPFVSREPEFSRESTFTNPPRNRGSMDAPSWGVHFFVLRDLLVQAELHSQ